MDQREFRDRGIREAFQRWSHDLVPARTTPAGVDPAEPRKADQEWAAAVVRRAAPADPRVAHRSVYVPAPAAGPSVASEFERTEPWQGSMMNASRSGRQLSRHSFPWGSLLVRYVEQRGWEEPSGDSRFKQGETDMGDKGKKDKGKKEQQKKAQLNPKEKRKQKKEKKEKISQ